MNELDVATKRASDPEYDSLFKRWEAALQSLNDLAKENNTLHGVIKGQIKANDSLGALEGQRHEIMAEQLNTHNSTVQDMGEEIDRLRSMLVAAGIDPDEGQK